MATLAEIADHLDLSVRSVSGLKRSGILPDAGRGTNDLNVCRKAYIGHLREVAAGRGSKDGTVDLVAERARLTRAQAEMTERKNAVAEGEYLERRSVHIMVTNTLAICRARLLSIPHKLAPFMAPAMSAQAAGGILKKGIYECLDDLASTKISEFDHGLELAIELVDADRAAATERASK